MFGGLPPQTETLKKLPKFEPRGHQGIFLGYYLQPGGIWKGEYAIFPLERFKDYDYERPRHLNDLRPRRTMEAKLNGPISFPLKEKYDIMKRTLPITILRDASVYGGGDDDDDGAAPGGDDDTKGGSDAAAPAPGEGGDSAGLPAENRSTSTSTTDTKDYDNRQLRTLVQGGLPPHRPLRPQVRHPIRIL